MTAPVTLRTVAPDDAAAIDWIAHGMRRTLVEVEGEEAGTAMYTLDWLRERVRFHFDAPRCIGQVVVAEADVDGAPRIVGHTILRIEADAAGRRFGLVTTTFVDPPSRRLGIADRLLRHGEAWFRARALPEAATWTSSTNTRLIRLYAKHGFAEAERGPNELTGTIMVRLAKPLAADADAVSR